MTSTKSDFSGEDDEANGENVRPIGNRLSELRDELDSLKELLDEETKMRLDAEEMVEQALEPEAARVIQRRAP